MAFRAAGTAERNYTQECILYTYSYKFTAGNLSGSYLALEDFKPIPQNSLHFPEAQYFHSLLSWLLLSSNTAKTSLHYLTLRWTNPTSWMKAALKINPFYCHLRLLAHILILFCDFFSRNCQYPQLPWTRNSYFAFLVF